jgi:hypothetical protein
MTQADNYLTVEKPEGSESDDELKIDKSTISSPEPIPTNPGDPAEGTINMLCSSDQSVILADTFDATLFI